MAYIRKGALESSSFLFSIFVFFALTRVIQWAYEVGRQAGTRKLLRSLYSVALIKYNREYTRLGKNRVNYIIFPVV